MVKQYNPYRRPFPRWYQLNHYSGNIVHPLQRAAKEAYFKKKNINGYHHDLGAMDVLFDNFGILIREQFNNQEIKQQYLVELPKLMLYWWQNVQSQIVHKRPFWNEYYNATSRDANAGEPRSLLRFIADEDLSRYNSDILDTYDRFCTQYAESSILSIFERGRFINPYYKNNLFPTCDYEGFDYADWNADDLFPEETFPPYSNDDIFKYTEHLPYAGGVVLPIGFPTEVDALRILHPRHCTPDLPVRIGLDKKTHELCKKLWRDQGPLGTCVSFAVAVALDLLVRRCCKGKTNVRFSPAWLHCMSARAGDTGATGRSLENVIDAVANRLPCSEQEYSYDPLRLADWIYSDSEWETANMVKSSRALTEQFGRPEIRKMDVQDISAIKAHLAAGWLVVVSTSITEEFWKYGILSNRYGLTLAPLKGQRREQKGHAWLLTGYDHVDGNAKWKYQGRFLTLNSWKIDRTLGQGVVTLPFAMLLTEGIEAYALRFPA